MIPQATVKWSSHPLLSSRKIEFLGCPMHGITMEETLGLAEQAMRERRPLHHVVVNVAKLITMRKNAELAEDVAGADLINVDGVGVLWGARLCGLELPERVAGVDIMLQLFGRCGEQGYRPYLLGAEQQVLDAVVSRLSKEHPRLKIAGMRNGYFKPEDEDDIVKAINDSGADCLLVAMPTPRKERFLKKYRQVLKPSFVMGVGGSFDVYGGKVARAPKIVQALGLEWLFRVMQEPKRLWRRYYETNTAYALLLGQEFRRAGAVLAEVKIEADRCAANAERAGEDLLDEILGRCRCERRVELHDDRSVEPAGSQEAQLVALAR